MNKSSALTLDESNNETGYTSGFVDFIEENRKIVFYLNILSFITRTFYKCLITDGFYQTFILINALEFHWDQCTFCHSHKAIVKRDTHVLVLSFLTS